MAEEKKLEDILQIIIDSVPDRLTLSKRSNRNFATGEIFENISEDGIIKIVILRKNAGKSNNYQSEKYTSTQVFHDNFSTDDLKDYLFNWLKNGFSVVNGECLSGTFNLRMTKKAKPLFSFNAANCGQASSCCVDPAIQAHNREKNYMIPEGSIVPPLVDMGIFTKEGKIVNSMQDKYRQINRFLEVVNDAVSKSGLDSLTVVDFGCGKSYLTFILYYYFTEIKHIDVTMIGLDLKSDVIRKCSLAAEKYGYHKLHFEVGDINGFDYYGKINMVVTLHACDTATDYALFNAIKWQTDMIFSVPCCQHEVNAHMKSDNLSIVTKYGLIKERIAALYTDAIRASLLEACGYKTQILEFIDMSHTPKNILIRAVRSNISGGKKKKSLEEVQALMKEFSIDQTLYRLLEEEAFI